MKNSFIYVLASLLFFSCEKKGNSSTSRLLGTEVVDLTEFDFHVVMEVLPLEKIDFIPLEFSENSTIKKVDKIVCLRDRIAVLDAKGVESVLFFDYQGNFLSSLSKKGMGPGEYGFLNDMDIGKLVPVGLNPYENVKGNVNYWLCRLNLWLLMKMEEKVAPEVHIQDIK